MSTMCEYMCVKFDDVDAYFSTRLVPKHYIIELIHLHIGNKGPWAHIKWTNGRRVGKGLSDYKLWTNILLSFWNPK